MHTLMSCLAIALYLSAAILQWRAMRAPADSAPAGAGPLLLLSIAAVGAHGIAAFTGAIAENGLYLGLLPMISMIMWFVATLTVFRSLHAPIASLQLMVLIAAAAIVGIVTIAAPGPAQPQQVAPGLFAHIVLSVLAYSVLTIAALQAVALSLQESRLREHRFGAVLNSLPPLQTMDSMLFEMISVGFVLLSLAVAAGALYIEDFFGQHLAHKTVFSMAAWAMFGTLLIGRRRHGWRAGTAVRWTLWGFGFLLLAYVGSQWVLEFLVGDTNPGR